MSIAPFLFCHKKKATGVGMIRSQFFTAATCFFTDKTSDTSHIPLYDKRDKGIYSSHKEGRNTVF